jgi:CRP/FNR family transcriptional regulator, cyclic AMP receptor protein
MQDQASLVAVLNSTWFASGLEPGIQTRLAELSRAFTAEPGQELFREGEESEVLGVVIKGRVALRTHVAERGDLTILTVEPGDIYLWSALVPPYRATSTAVAIEALEAITFEGPALRAALREDAKLAQALYPRVLVAVERRLNATRVQLLDLFAAKEVRTW